MTRELTTMSVEEVHAWCRDRDEEIETAYASGDITLPVRMSLQEWVQNSYCDYLMALSKGLLRMGD